MMYEKKICPNCHLLFPADVDFCNQCGTHLQVNQVLTPPAKDFFHADDLKETPVEKNEKTETKPNTDNPCTSNKYFSTTALFFAIVSAIVFLCTFLAILNGHKYCPTSNYISYLFDSDYSYLVWYGITSLIALFCSIKLLWIEH